MHQVEPIGEKKSQWGEGPIWTGGALLYVDIEGKQVIRFEPHSGKQSIWDVSAEVGRVGTVVPRQSGGMLVAGDKGIFSLSEAGELVQLADPEPEKPNNRFNDGKCSPDGHFFAGTISLVKNEGDAALYKYSKDGEISQVYPGVTNSNGLAWTKDGATMFYIDTPTKKVLAFPYADGALAESKVVIDTSALDASPDGMAIDENDHLWIAFCHGACVICYDPTTGAELRRIDFPCLETTACAFGGENLDVLYVTTGIHSTEVEEHAGRLFQVTGLGVRGQAGYSFQG